MEENNEQIENNVEVETEHVADANADVKAESVDSEDKQSEQENVEDYSKNVAKRINKLTSKLSEKDAELQALRQQLSERNNVAQTQQTEDKKPTLEDYATIEEFTEALTDYKLRQKEIQQIQQQTEQKRFSTYNERVKEFSKNAPDFTIAVQEVNDKLVSDKNIADFILESDVGPAIAYKLANDEDALEKLMSMSSIRRISYLTKLEAQFENKKQSVETKSEKKTITRVTTNSGSSADIANDYASWKKARMQKRK